LIPTELFQFGLGGGQEHKLLSDCFFSAD
jgi:hypothetical protein